MKSASVPVYSGHAVSRFGCFLDHYVSGSGEIPSVTFAPWDETDPVTIEAPPGFNVIGWSPDARYVLLAPKSDGFLLDYCPVPSMDTRSGSAMEAALLFDRVTSGSRSDRKEALPLTLWDREQDLKSHLFDLDLRAPEGAESYADAVNGLAFFLTTRGILSFVRTAPEKTARELVYCDFTDRTWRTIDLAVTDPTAWINVASVSPDGSAFLLYAPFHGLSPTPASAPASQVSEPTEERRLVLVEPEAGTATLLPLSVAARTPQHLRFTLMNDGTILGIQEDRLLRYDPKTGAKDVIVDNLLETWDKLGENGPKE